MPAILRTAPQSMHRTASAWDAPFDAGVSSRKDTLSSPERVARMERPSSVAKSGEQRCRGLAPGASGGMPRIAGRNAQLHPGLQALQADEAFQARLRPVILRQSHIQEHEKMQQPVHKEKPATTATEHERALTNAGLPDLRPT